MDFTVGTAIFAGLIGTVVMTAFMYVAAITGMKMDMPMMLGTMFTRRGTAAWVIGAMMHLAMGAMFFLAYAGLFDVLGIESAVVAWAALFGGAHGLIAGMALGMMPAMHPRLEPAGAAPGAGVPAPGMFALRFGLMGPVAVVMLHVVYAAVAAAVYTA